MTTATREFLDSLRPGDVVMQIMRSGWGTTLGSYTVERLTATQIVMKNGDHVRLSDGKIIGHDYRYLQMPPSEEEISEIRRAERRTQLAIAFEYREWRKDSLETLEAVARLLEPPAST